MLVKGEEAIKSDPRNLGSLMVRTVLPLIFTSSVKFTSYEAVVKRVADDLAGDMK